MFGRKNKVQRINYNNNMEKLEDLTGKLPILEMEDKKFKRSRFEARSLDKIIEAFRSVPDDDVYSEVLKTVLNVMKSYYGVFGYIDSVGAFVCPSLTKIVWDKCQVVQKDYVFPKGTWGKSIWGRAIIQNRVLYSNQPFKVPGGHIPIRRALMVPVVYHKKVIGLFELANKKKDYTKDDVDIMKKIARLISPILMARLQRDGVLEKEENNASW